MDPSSTTTERGNQHVDINIGGDVETLIFSANGEYLLSGECGKVRVWRVEDGREVATSMETPGMVNCLAVSRDGNWIAAGTGWNGLSVWDPKSHQKVWQHSWGYDTVYGVDFSPDSARLIVAGENRTATVFKAATWQVALELDHQDWVFTAKYSPKGDQIATATYKSIRVWDSNDGRLLIFIEDGATLWYNRSLLWFDNHLFVVSDNKLKRFDASTGSTVAEWQVQNSNDHSCIALSQHGEFIACSANGTVLVWDPSTHTQLCRIQQPEHIYSISLSPDARFIAIGSGNGKITIKNLSIVVASFALSRVHLAFQEPDIPINDAILDSWKHDRLANVEESLTAAITTSESTNLLELACRAIVRTRLRNWDGAIVDAEKSIGIQPSALAYIAKSIALVGNGESHKAYRACDIAFEHLHSMPVVYLLLIKAIIVFMAGEHDDAISRIDDLIATIRDRAICYQVQAYMHLLVGKLCMENRDFEGAIQAFGLARSQARGGVGHPIAVISLISGWKFEDLNACTLGRFHCEALYSARRTNEATESLLDIMDNLQEEVYMSGPASDWFFDFARRCLCTPDVDINTDSSVAQPSVISSSNPTPLLRLWAKLTLDRRSRKSSLADAVNFVVPKFTIYRVLCEQLEMADRIMEALDCLREMVTEHPGLINTDDERGKWANEFKQRCATKLARFGDEAVNARRYDVAITQYSNALSLDPVMAKDILIKRSRVYVLEQLWEEALNDASRALILDPISSWGYRSVLEEWARQNLTNGSWRNAVSSASSFKVSKFAIYQVLCTHLDLRNCIVDASNCFREMENELPEEQQGDEAIWISEFRDRCCNKLEGLGDTAMSENQYAQAISYYSAALSLGFRHSLCLKRSKAHAAKGLWKNALEDADTAIKLDQTSLSGYECRYEALRGAKLYKDMLDAFETMVSKMSRSPDPNVHTRWELCSRAIEAIRKAIPELIRDTPRVLVNTRTGRLCDKSQQAAAIESSPIFMDLVLSAITHIDHMRIEQVVKDYYRYATFSHRWEPNEPLYDKVVRIIVYELDKSLTHDKLQMFCKIVREAGFEWAWSDTCCINKADHFVLQEALVAMFKWYEGSGLTVIFLRGVHSSSLRPNSLVESDWNTRVWTFQEYHASKVVRFYTEDWKPYLNLDIANHKESLEIISEMEMATGISAQALTALQPGLDDIREKLCLASRRKTTLVEDAAYSLLGIFSISMPIVYGEGDKALGRLLAQLLASSGEMSILAWTGKSGSFNSCLPAHMTVFQELPTTYIPVSDSQFGTSIAALLASSLDPVLMVRFSDRLLDLPVPSFTGRRMKLPCLTFKLGPLSGSRSESGWIFRAKATALGAVEIRTNENLSRLDSFYLIHPWIDFLLDRQPVGNVMETITEEPEDSDFRPSSVEEPPSFPGPPSTRLEPQDLLESPLLRRFNIPSILGPTSPTDTASLRPPSSLTQADKQMQALQVISRLKKPFGALLLTPSGGAAYRRVAAGNLITVQVVEQITPTIMNKLIDSIRILDVL